MRKERSSSNLSWRVRSSADQRQGAEQRQHDEELAEKRAQTICTIGMCAWVTRFFAEVSRAENSATARHIRPTAFRRSAAGMDNSRRRRGARPSARLGGGGSVPVLSSHGRLSSQGRRGGQRPGGTGWIAVDFPLRRPLP